MVQLKTPRYGRLKSFWIALIDPVEDLSDQCGFGYRLPYPILFPKLIFLPGATPKLVLSLRLGCIPNSSFQPYHLKTVDATSLAVLDLDPYVRIL